MSSIAAAQSLSSAEQVAASQEELRLLKLMEDANR
jgi:hypothetical protein